MQSKQRPQPAPIEAAPAPAPLSEHFQRREPSEIRRAQILFAKRPDRDQLRVVNMAIGNVSRPMHPAMIKRLHNLGSAQSPFRDGVVKYSASVGTEEAQRAFLHVIEASGSSVEDLRAVVTDGGSQAMELMILGVCGPHAKRPLLLLDPAYTNYLDFCNRAGVRTVAIRREQQPDGSFSAPTLHHLDRVMQLDRPAGVVVIPADNPTGQFLSTSALAGIARLCVKHGMWLVGDEAYRQLHYGDEAASSIWALTEEQVPGVTGRRISIESASKVWNACGLRLGALVTDSPDFHERAVAEHTASLCANVVGQYVFGALGELGADELHTWFDEQRDYYRRVMTEVAGGLRRELPGVIVSDPEASLYSVVDVRDLTPPRFSAADFVAYCAQTGRVRLDGVDHTLLVSPMGGFYADDHPSSATQMRLAFVEPEEEMRKAPKLFAELFRAYLAR